MDETGITRWLEQDFAAAMADLDSAMRGELAPDEVHVDLRPLQAALQGDAMRAAIGRVLEQLPPCSAQELQRWQELVPGAEGEQDMPACNPGPEALAHSRAVLIAAAAELPDRMPLFEAGHAPTAFRVPAWLRACVWLAFLAPLLLLALGAWLAGREAAGFWSWFGGIALSAGALVLLVIWIAGGLLGQPHALPLNRKTPTRSPAGKFRSVGAGFAGALDEDPTGRAALAHHQLHPPVLGPAGGGAVGRDRPLFAVAHRLEAFTG